MRKLTVEQMKDKIQNQKYYITYYWEDDSYELSHDTGKRGYAGGVKITKERAQEWLEAGAKLLKM